MGEHSGSSPPLWLLTCPVGFLAHTSVVHTMGGRFPYTLQRPSLLSIAKGSRGTSLDPRTRTFVAHNEPCLSLRTHAVNVRTAQPPEGQRSDHSCPTPPFCIVHRGYGLACHPVLRAGDDVGQRIPMGPSVWKHWVTGNNWKCVREQAGLSWSPRGCSTRLRGYFGRPGLGRTPTPGHGLWCRLYRQYISTF